MLKYEYMIFASLIVVSLFTLSLGGTVFVNNPRSRINKIFGLFSLSSALWMITNALALDSSPIDLELDARNFVTQLIVVCSSLAAIFFLLFVELFVHITKLVRRLTFVILAFSLAVNSVAFTNAYSRVEDGTTVVGDYYSLFSFSIACYMALTAYVLYAGRSVSRVTDTQKLRQLNYLRVGYILAVIPSFVFGGILTIFSSGDLPSLSPVFLIFFVSFAAAAIVKHKLFDIRIIVARSLAYFLLFTTLIGAYSLIIFLLSSVVVEGSNVSLAEQIVNLLYVVVMAFTLVPLRHFFDKITNNIFYRDAYDTQEFLNAFNEKIVSTIDVVELLKRASVVIERYIKPEFCGFYINETRISKGRLINIPDANMRSMNFQEVRDYLGTSKQRLVVTNDLEEKDLLRAHLHKSNVGILVAVTSTSTKNTLGYLLLGYKKSGNLYNRQDKGAIEIIANELAIAIQNALRFEEIQNFAATLQDKVDEATKNLRRANEKLKQMDQTKDDFISMASHQLRTPLTSVKGYVSMVLEGDAGKITSKQKELLDQAFISSQRMVYLIADLLNVSRLRTGKFIIEAKPTNLADVVQGEIAQLTQTAKSRKLELTYEKPKDFPILMLDDTKIRQVIMNFADNAIYYTPAGGHISVQLKEADSTVEFLVVDDGMGVPRSEQHHLFNKFYRAGNAKKARPDGTGLGLFMAKKVVIAQGGSIIFHSEEGKGSTFGFSFAKKALSPESYKPTTLADKPTK